MPKLLLAVGGAAVVAVLAVAGTVTAQSDQRFDDVPTDAYYYAAVNWAVDNGITSGCGDGTNFCPDKALTRAHVVTFLHRAIAPEFSVSGVGDDDDRIITDDAALEPGYYTARVWFDDAPGVDWTDGKTRDFYVWFGSKRAGGRVLVSGAHNSAPLGYLDVRVDDAEDYWFTIRADDDFVWWASVDSNRTPDGVTFD